MINECRFIDLNIGIQFNQYWKHHINSDQVALSRSSCLLLYFCPLVSRNMKWAPTLEKVSPDSTSHDSNALDVEALQQTSIEDGNATEENPVDTPRAQGVDAGYAIDWDGPDDPQNPHNWTATKKWLTIILISAITFNQ